MIAVLLETGIQLYLETTTWLYGIIWSLFLATIFSHNQISVDLGRAQTIPRYSMGTVYLLTHSAVNHPVVVGQ